MDITDQTHICVITSSFPRTKEDYSGIFIFDLLGSLAKTGFHFRVIAPRNNEDRFFFKKEGKNENIEIFRFGFFFNYRWEKLAYRDGMLNNFKKSLLAKIQLPFYLAAALFSALIHLKNCRVIWSHWAFPSGLIGAVLKKLTARRHILSIHSNWSFLLRYGVIGRAIARFIIHNSDHISTVNYLLKKETLDIFKGKKELKEIEKKVFVLPMGILKENFSPPVKDSKSRLRERYNLGHGKVILYIGRLVPIKGVQFLIEAVKDFSGATLIIAGKGSQEESLREMAKTAQCKVEFWGVVSGQKKMELFRLSDIVVIPSVGSADGQTEGTPLVLLEAMANGTPIVASNIGGIRKVIKHGRNGLLVKKGDIRELKENLSLILNDPRLYGRICGKALKKSYRYEMNYINRRFIKMSQLS